MFSSGLDLDEKSRELAAAKSRWLFDLAGLLPTSMLQPKGPRIVLRQTDQGAMHVFTSSNGQLAQIGSLGAKEPLKSLKQLKASLKTLSVKDADVIMQLAARHVLQREIRLPKAARDVLEPVIANQMDELTPWPPGESTFGYRIADGDDDTDDDQFTVNVVATSRKIIDDALASAQALNLKPTVIEFAAPEEPDNGIVVFGEPNQARIKVTKRLDRALSLFLWVAATAGGIGISIMLWQQLALSNLQDQASTHRAALASITRRDAPALKLQKKSREITSLKTARPSVLITLEALSRALPDTAWLINLEVRADEVRLKGKADSASDLIAVLEKLPYFEDVRFSAPTTRSDNERQETFAISAKMLPVTRLE